MIHVTTLPQSCLQHSNTLTIGVITESMAHFYASVATNFNMYLAYIFFVKIE